MGRYSFFILGFCYRSNYVHADSVSADLLLDSSSTSDVSSSDSTVDSTSSVLDSFGSVQQEESPSTAVSEESSEESVSDSLDNTSDISEEITISDSPFKNFFDMFGGTIEILYDDENTFYEKIGKLTRAMWTGTNFSTVKVTGADVPGVPTDKLGNIEIGPAFSSWKWPAGTSDRVVTEGILRASKNSIYATNNRIDGLFNNFDSLNSRVNSINSTVSGHTTQISNAFSRISTLESWKAGATTGLNGLYKDRDTLKLNVANLQSLTSSHSSSISNISSRVGTLETALASNDVYLSAILASMNTHKDQTTTNFATLFNYLKSTNTKLDGLDEKFKSNNTSLSAILTSTNTHKDQTTTNFATLFNYLKSTNTKLDGLDEKFKSNNTNLSAILTSMNTHKDQTTTNFSRLWNYLISTNSKLDSLINKKDFSDIGIIAAIIGLHDTWKSKNYTAGILEDDGDAVKLMKSVAILISSHVDSIPEAINLLKTNIQAQFDLYFSEGGFFWKEYDKRWNNFPLWLQGLLNNYFDNIYNMDNKDSLLYRLVYFFIDEMTKTRDFVIEINDNVLIANDSLLLIVDWLRMLYNKPLDNISVNVPAFDYDRLADMLSKIQMNVNVGDTINEAGDNLWTVLKELIKNLGSIFETGLHELGETARSILDFLDGLIDKIIELIVPKNTKFLDDGFESIKSKIDIKFSSFLSLGSQVKEVVQPIDQDFKKTISIDIMGAKFNPNFSTIDWFVARFRTVMSLSIWMSVAIYVYRKITGNGDLINDN